MKRLNRWQFFVIKNDNFRQWKSSFCEEQDISRLVRRSRVGPNAVQISNFRSEEDSSRRLHVAVAEFYAGHGVAVTAQGDPVLEGRLQRPDHGWHVPAASYERIAGEMKAANTALRKREKEERSSSIKVHGLLHRGCIQMKETKGGDFRSAQPRPQMTEAMRLTSRKNLPSTWAVVKTNLEHIRFF